MKQCRRGGAISGTTIGEFSTEMGGMGEIGVVHLKIKGKIRSSH